MGARWDSISTVFSSMMNAEYLIGMKMSVMVCINCIRPQNALFTTLCAAELIINRDIYCPPSHSLLGD